MRCLAFATLTLLSLTVPALAAECTGTPGVKLVPVFAQTGGDGSGVKWDWKGAAFAGLLNAAVPCTLGFTGQEGDRVIVNLVAKPAGSVVMVAGVGRDLVPLVSGKEVLLGKTGTLTVQLSRADGVRGSVAYDLAWDFIYKTKP